MPTVSSDIAAMLKTANKLGARNAIDAADALKGFVDASKYGVVPGGSDLHSRLQEALEESGSVTVSEPITLTGQVNVPSGSRLVSTAGTITLNLADTVTPAFVLTDVSDVVLSINTFTQQAGQPIFATGSTNIHVVGCKINHGASDLLVGGGALGGMWFENCSDVYVIRNRVSRVRAKGIQFRGGNENIHIVNNWVDLCSRAGISIDRKNDTVRILNNYVSRTNRTNVVGAADGAIDVYGANTEGEFSTDVHIIGNTVAGVGGLFGSMDIGPSLVRVNSVQGGLLTHNTLVASGIVTSILTLNSRTNTAVKDFDMVSNHIENHADGATLGLVSIALSDDTYPHERLKFYSNKMIARGAVATTPMFMRLRTPIHTLDVHDNEFRCLDEAKPGVISQWTGNTNFTFSDNEFPGCGLCLDVRTVNRLKIRNNDGTGTTRLCNLISNADVRLSGNIPATQADIYTTNTGLVGSYDMPLVSADKGNASASIPPTNTSEGTAVWNTPFTANRTCTLLTSNILPGTRQRIVRTASATGAFVLNIGSGPLTTLDAGQWAEVQFDGTAWILTGKGSL